MPQYRRIGDHVFIRGSVTNITAVTTFAQLPTGFAPKHNQYRVLEATGSRMARVLVTNGGYLRFEIIYGGDWLASNWHTITMDYFLK